MVHCLDVTNVMFILSYLFDRKKNVLVIIFFYHKLKRDYGYGIGLSLKANVIHYYNSAN